MHDIWKRPAKTAGLPADWALTPGGEYTPNLVLSDDIVVGIPLFKSYNKGDPPHNLHCKGSPLFE